MHMLISEDKADLRMRFTAWLKIAISRAKINYIKHQKRFSTEIPIEEKNDFEEPTYNIEDKLNLGKKNFEFENDKLAFAFSNLNSRRKQILIMIFIQNLTPKEIAEFLKCKIQNVYNHYSLALKELKLRLDQ